MKTMIKLASQRSTIPVLNMILCDGKKLYATDMDIMITQKAGKIKAGIYHAAGFENDNVRREADKSNALDFPSMTLHREGLSDLVTFDARDIEALKFVARAQSTEQARYYLNGVYFHENICIATDGHRLHRMTLSDGQKFDKGFIVPRQAIKVLLDMIAETKADEFTVQFSDNRVLFGLNGIEIISKEIDGTFPDYVRVIPSIEACKKIAGDFDPKTFKKILPEAKAIYKIQYATQARDRHIALKLEGGTAKMSCDKQTWKTGMNFPTAVGFNAFYLSDACAGLFTYQDATGPCRIEQENILAVIMPTRV